MKILIQSLNFPPELIGVGKYVGEMAVWLKNNGHDVHVITGMPYYPLWKIHKGFNKYFWRKEYLCGVTVWRCPIWVPKNPTGLKRLAHLFSFFLSSLPIALMQIMWRPRIVFTVQPTLFVAPTALFICFFTGAKKILHIQDFEVDAAFELKILRGKLIRKIILTLEKFIMLRFDLISSISKMMLKRAELKGVSESKLYLFRNWVKLNPFFETLHKNENQSQAVINYRKKLNIHNDSLVALYSGNMGEKQGIEILGYVAKIFHNVNQSNLYFIFCGNGPSREKLEAICDGLKNVLFLDLQTEKNFHHLLSIADIHLLPQQVGAQDLVLPSKLTGMLASGRAIIACANKGTEIESIVSECGVVVPPENPEKLYEAILELVKNPDKRKDLGEKGRNYAIKNLDQEIIMSNFNLELYKFNKGY